MSTPKAAYLSFSAEVNPTTVEQLLAAVANLGNRGVKEVHLLLSTPGGNVREGLNAYNVLRALPVKLTTYNVGTVDSIGNVIFLAGERRLALPSTTFMFHGVGFTIGNTTHRFEEKDLRERLDGIEADHAKIASVIYERGNFEDEAEVRALFLAAATKDTAYALEKGLVHEVRRIEIPAGSPVQQFVFSR